ncbi:MAG: UvrD-helicase domain-containing protein [Acidobacteriota bacterium]
MSSLMDLFAAGDAPSADHLAGLNDEQREATKTTAGPMLILAGAGSGKTRVITQRIAYLIESSGVRPESILAVTFTNKAAGEMKERVNRLLAGYYARGSRSGAPLICTFHSLCVRILRRDIQRLDRGYTRSFTIYDSDDQQRLLKQVIKDIGLDEKQLPVRLAKSAISSAKNRGESPETYASRSEYGDPRREPIARAYTLYEQRLEASNALDFDDLLIRALQLLKHSAETRRHYHERFRHVMVDEFQDTNGIQYNLTRLIVEGDGALNPRERKADDFWRDRSFCVVGDESQSIYGWRGSDFKIILGFKDDFPGTRVVKLEENYRSTRRILEAANGVISNNKQRFDKALRTKASEGDKIGYAQLMDGDAEARWITRKIEDHLAKEPETRAAVLYRTNAQSRLFEEACRRAGLRYNLVGGFSFYERAEVKDVIAYLRLALNPHDSIALLRVINTPVRGIGKSTLDEIGRRAKESSSTHWDAIALVIEEQQLQPRAISALKAFQEIVRGLGKRTQTEGEPISEIVKAAVIDTGYERSLKEENSEEAEARLLNLEELVNAAAESEEQGETLRDFLDHAALVADTDDYTGAAQVTLMTMHAAKGLEFPVVFIAGLEESVFPNPRVKDSESDLEEERRLCYVAITRAERNLYLTHAARRRVYGEEHSAEPSRFLNEFPRTLIDDLSTVKSWHHHGGPAPAPAKQPWQEARSKRTSNYQGKTHDNVDSVRDFFARRGQTVDTGDFKKARGGEQMESSSASGLKAGMKVRHATYGQGLIVKCEGEGDNSKLTISFPGYGMKKMIEKYAKLEKV